MPGSDTFIECYTGRSDWTFIDDEARTDSGTYLQEDDASFESQVDEMKLYLVRKFGESIKRSQLRVSNHRSDRYDW
jgi:hypothetical protein